MLGNPDYSRPRDMVSAPIAEGAVNDSESARVWFRVDTAKMTVFPEKDHGAVQSTMPKSILGSAEFPEIRFESTSIRQVGEGKWTVIGNLTLHGETRSITMDVHNEGGACRRVQDPTNAIWDTPRERCWGLVKVKDELKMDFVIVVRK